jgi:hypothetical protein
MSSFSVCWNRRSLAWRRHSKRAPWQLEAILCERVLLEGRPALRIVARLAGILEDEIEDLAAREHFWSAAQRKLGKLRRLNQRDLWKIEALIAERIPRAAHTGTNVPVSTIRPSAHPIRDPHQPLQGTFRAR